MKVLVASLLLLVSSLAFGQSLWGGTRYGMTVEEVRRAVPQVSTPSKPSSLNNGAKELLRLPNVEIVNEKFDAHFYFLSNQLVQVSLSLNNSRSFESSLLVFDSLLEALRAKYGKELNRSIERGTLNKADATWMSGRTNVGVFVLSVGTQDAVFNVNYQMRIAKDADKL